MAENAKIAALRASSAAPPQGPSGPEALNMPWMSRPGTELIMPSRATLPPPGGKSAPPPGPPGGAGVPVIPGDMGGKSVMPPDPGSSYQSPSISYSPVPTEPTLYPNYQIPADLAGMAYPDPYAGIMPEQNYAQPLPEAQQPMYQPVMQDPIYEQPIGVQQPAPTQDPVQMYQDPMQTQMQDYDFFHSDPYMLQMLYGGYM